jgi:hypothetical protein
MIPDVTFYGGIHHLKTFDLVETPPSIRIETDEIFGFYRLEPEGIGGIEYHWKRPSGQWTAKLQKKIENSFPKS